MVADPSGFGTPAVHAWMMLHRHSNLAAQTQEMLVFFSVFTVRFTKA